MKLTELAAKVADLQETLEKAKDDKAKLEAEIETTEEELRVYLTCLQAIQEDKREEQELFAVLCAQTASDGVGVDNHRQYAIDRGIEFVWPDNEKCETDQEGPPKVA